MTVVDTAFVVDAMRGDPGALQVVAGWDEEGWALHVPVPVLHEIQRGLVLSKRPLDEAQRIRAALEGLRVLPYTAASARVAGDIEAALWATGQPIGIMDCMIAATAMQHGMAVLTRDTGHFDRITGLQVQTY